MYPLRERGLNREACIRTILDAGLPNPGKSACWFCPAMRAIEILKLRTEDPDFYRLAIEQAVAIAEQNAGCSAIMFGHPRSDNDGNRIVHCVMSTTDAERLEVDGLEFAWLFRHNGHIMTIPNKSCEVNERDGR